jgi:hypothetical protein
MAKSTIRMEGYVWTFHQAYQWKEGAKHEANNLRDMGVPARVIKLSTPQHDAFTNTNFPYAVYMREGKINSIMYQKIKPTVPIRYGKKISYKQNLSERIRLNYKDDIGLG